MRRHAQRLFGLALACGIAAGMAGAAHAAPELKLLLASSGAPKPATKEVLWTELVKPNLEKYSDGRIEVEVQGRGSLCSEVSCVEQLTLGQIDITSISSGNVGAFGTVFDIINLPYLFKDSDAANRILRGWLAEELKKRSASEMGLHTIALIPVGGFRNIVTTDVQVRKPSDLKGVKIRTTKSPTEFNLIKSWGAAPIPYAWASLYEGLQAGVVEGMYLQDAYTAASKFYEVCDHITRTGGAWSAHAVLMAETRYQKLPQWARDAIDRVGTDLEAKAFEVDEAWIAGATAEMEGKVQSYDPTPEEMKAWHEGAVAAWVAVKGAYDPALARRALEEQDEKELIASLEAAGAL